jgi:hypothetical protein
MTRLWLWLVLVVCLLGCAKPQPQASASKPAPKPASGVFFVATNGNDQWSGRLPAPDRKGADGPFATLSGALKTLRGLRQQQDSAAGRSPTVFVGGGFYFAEGPIVFTPADSNLVLAAYPGQKPVLSGGRPVTGWKEVTVQGKKLWAADIPQVRDGKWYFRELWVNGQRATRARHPHRGYLGIADLVDKAPEWTQGHTRFRFREGDLKAWDTVTNAEVVVMTRWVESRLPVIGVDEKEHIVRFSKRSVFELAPGDLYYAEGAFEFLDEPGEWYLDAASGTLYYLPRPGERLAEIQAIAPVLTQVFRFEGRPEAGQFVERVVLRGLTFSHTEWSFPTGLPSGTNKANVFSTEPRAEISGFAQAAVGVPGAVWGEGLRDSAFEDCRFADLGNYGLELARGCQRNGIIRCEFSDLGAGGAKIGETRMRDQAAEQAGANEIIGCRIHDGGKMFPSAVGIWIGQSPGNRITHNLIYDFYYTGISIGWTWGYGRSLATNNTVELNHVHHIGAKSDGDGPILSDMGGIYTLGKQPGTVIRHNLWHDIAAIRYGGWGIYFDEGSSGILAENNVVYRTTHGGFHQHYGETNIVRNNIFAFARDHQLQRTRPEPHRSFSFVTNIVYFDSGSLLTGDWSGDQYQMDWNVYFDARPDAKPDQLSLGPCIWEKWQERGHDQHSLVADPLFVALRENDFRLQPNSPAFSLGFRPIDLSGVGP